MRLECGRRKNICMSPEAGRGGVHLFKEQREMKVTEREHRPRTRVLVANVVSLV